MVFSEHKISAKGKTLWPKPCAKYFFLIFSLFHPYLRHKLEFLYISRQVFAIEILSWGLGSILETWSFTLFDCFHGNFHTSCQSVWVYLRSETKRVIDYHVITLGLDVHLMLCLFTKFFYFDWKKVRDDLEEKGLNLCRPRSLLLSGPSQPLRRILGTYTSVQRTCSSNNFLSKIPSISRL